MEEDLSDLGAYNPDIFAFTTTPETRSAVLSINPSTPDDMGLYYMVVDEIFVDNGSLSGRVIYAIEIVTCTAEWPPPEKTHSYMYVLGDVPVIHKFNNADSSLCSISLREAGANPQTEYVVKNIDGSKLNEELFTFEVDTTTMDATFTVLTTEERSAAGFYDIEFYQ